MNKKTKRLIKNLVFITTLVVVMVIGSQAFADRDLEIEYPDINPSAAVPTTTKTLLPSYFLYVFYFALIFSGVIIFGSILMGGISWLSSMGNPAALSDSKNRVFSAFLGVILLLSSFLLLNTINPEITMMKLPGITNKKFIKISFGSGPDIITKASIPFLSNSSGTAATSLSYDNTNADEVNIVIYSDDNYKGTSQEIIAAGSLPFQAKSISIAWKLPGVYLFSNTDYQGDVRLYVSSQSILPDFGDKAKSIKVYSSKPVDRLAVVLHEDENFQGKCAVIFNNNLTSLENQDMGGIVGNSKTSSITVLKPLRTGLSSLSGGVKFLDEEGNAMQCSGTYCKSQYFLQNVKSSTASVGIQNNRIYGLEITGDYVAILFDGNSFNDDCEVFTGSDLDFSDNVMGKCDAWLPCLCIPILNWCAFCRGSCVSSLIVFPLTY